MKTSATLTQIAVGHLKPDLPFYKQLLQHLVYVCLHLVFHGKFLYLSTSCLLICLVRSHLREGKSLVAIVIVVISQLGEEFSQYRQRHHGYSCVGEQWKDYSREGANLLSRKQRGIGTC